MALRATIGVGANPVAVAVDQSTHTAYVGNGNDNTVSVINTATCNAKVHSGCDQKPPTIAVGPGPVDDAVDLKTDTIYVVALGSDTVSVINGATCNAAVRSGCTRTPPTVTVGGAPDGVAIDQVTDTVYVTNDGPNGDNAGHTVSVIDGTTFNGQVTSGCGQTPATVSVGLAPAVPAVNQKTDTVYVPNSNPNGSGSVSVIDGATCNATVHSGCRRTPPRVPVGPSPFGAAVDQATNTVYVTSVGPNLGLVDVIDGRTCNAAVTSGCHHVSARVTVGSVPVGVVVDPRTRSAFVLNQEDSTVSVIDVTTCTGRHTAGCGRRPPVIATGFFPGYFDVDAGTGTVYVSSQDEDSVSVLDGAACSQTHQTGCRHPAPTTTVGDAAQGLAVNQRTNTVYVGNRNDDDLSVISATRCNAGHRRGCHRAWPTVSTGVPAQAVAVDERTDTIYTANSGPDNNGAGDTVSVIDGADCNARVTSGCGRAPGMVKVGKGPYALAVNEHTNTVYVANATDNTVPVINGATCDATVQLGCGQTPATFTVPAADYVGDVDESTDTVYVEVANGNTGAGGVWVINGARCNGMVRSGCGAHATASIAPDIYPSGVHVDQRTDSVYVVDDTSTFAGRVAVIDGAACNAHVTEAAAMRRPP